MVENNNLYKIKGHVTLEKMKPKLPKSKDQLTFDTTLRMNNHLKNFMKALVILGYETTQQKAVNHSRL